MDNTERIVEQYLRGLGFEDVVFEPDGNVPPDFLVGRSLAVEVRRLNKHESSSGDLRGIEETQIPLLMRMRRLLASFGAPPLGITRFVFYSFHRPLPSWRQLEPDLRHWLTSVMLSAERGRLEKTFANRLTVSIVHASKAGESAFELGGFSDYDAGGFVLYELTRNAAICIEEKTKKVEPYRAKYPEWWLVLVDHISYALPGTARDLAAHRMRLDYEFDRVILVSPLDPMQYFELPRAAGD